jgi:aldose 1-epimerase
MDNHDSNIGYCYLRKILVTMISKKWGHAGKNDIFLFNVEYDGLKMAITNLGATVQSLWVPDRDGHPVDVVLGYQSAAAYGHDPFHMGCVVGRYAGRIAGGELPVNGKLFQVSKNLDTHHLHGGFSGFNKKIFQHELITTDNQTGVRFYYESAPGEEGFPGRLRLNVTYTLHESKTWTVEYEAETDEPTHINFTQHSYFNLHGVASEITDHELQIFSDRFLLTDERLIPTGAFQYVGNTPFDFREPVSIGLVLHQKNKHLETAHGFDHTWVLENPHTEKLKKAARLISPVTGIVLDVETTEPGIHVYTSNFLKDQPGSKFPFQKYGAVCLETQHFPDSPHHAHFPSTLLLPGEVFNSKTIFRFSH